MGIQKMSGEYIGVAQIRLPNGELYAACPMTYTNLGQLDRWLEANWHDLRNEALPKSQYKAYEEDD
jgi:hypothetical protein